MNRIVEITRNRILVPALLTLAALPPAGVQGQTDEGVLTVSGTGSVELPADRARISFGVDAEAAQAEAAAAANAEAMERVIRALRSSDDPELELETSGFNVSPVYSRRQSGDSAPPSIVGYRVSNQVVVTTRDLDGVGELLDAGLAAGANRISGLQFFAEASDEARDEAYRLAVANARGQATALAEAMGVALGAPLQVRGSLGGSTPRPVMMEMAAADVQRSTRTPIEAGTTTVTASVTIEYRINR